MVWSLSDVIAFRCVMKHSFTALTLAFTLCCVVTSCTGPAYVLPADRLVEWRPGVEGGIPEYPVRMAIDPEDLPTGEGSNSAPVIQGAIDTITTPGVILLPEGTFHLTEGILMRSGVVLRGRGLDKTRLIFNAPRLGRDPGTWGRGAISFDGEWTDEPRPILAGYEAGSRELVLESTDGLEPGQMVRVDAKSDLEEMYGVASYGEHHIEDWMEAGRTYARRAVHQIVRIEEVRGETIILDVPLRLSRMHLEPKLRPMNTLKGAGVEALHLTRLDTAPGSIIRFSRAENCWVRDCETYLANRSHISMGGSRFITIESNYIHDAHDFSGGHAYGVTAGSDCLVWNNVFRRLRHAMVTSFGANGNVWAYNFSHEQDQDGRHRLRDISVHGHFPHMELFEGNVAEFATSSDWWGAAGPLITFFRNRFDTTLNHKPDHGGWNAPLQILNGSHRQNVVGNSMVSGQGIEVADDCKDAFVEANLVRGEMVWNALEPEGRRLRDSLFLESPPPFWGNIPWPAIGADVDAENTPDYVRIPAQVWAERMQAEGRSIPFTKER